MKKTFKTLIASTIAVGMLVTPMGIHAVEPTPDATPVASIGDTQYNTLEEAATAVTSGGEIDLLADLELAGKIRFENKNVTVDLNGHDLTAKGRVFNVLSASESLTIKDTSADQSGIIDDISPIFVEKGGSFTLESGTIKGRDFAVSGNGLDTIGTTVNIKGGSLIQTVANDPETAAIYQPQPGVVNVSGGSITGSVGIQMCSGTLTVTGGTITGTDVDIRTNKTGDGPIGDGSAISVVERAYPGGTPVVNISGGTINSTQSKSVLAYTYRKEGTVSDWAEAGNFVKISGGTFNTTPADYVVSGKKAFEVDGKFVVAPSATGITLDAASLNIQETKTAKLTATVEPTDTLDTVAYTSSDETVATVAEDGTVTAITAGTTTITATVGDKTATCEVSVYKAAAPEVPTVKPDEPTEDVQVGVNDEESKKALSDSVNSIIEKIDTADSSVVSAETVEKIKDAIATGKTISTTVKADLVEETAVKPAEVTVIKEMLAQSASTNNTTATIAQYLDISVLLNADGSALGTIEKLDKAIELSVVIPTDLKQEGRNFYVVRVHNGVAEKLETTLNADGTLSFLTDKFSTYALAYEDEKTTSETPSESVPSEETSSEQTSSEATSSEETSSNDVSVSVDGTSGTSSNNATTPSTGDHTTPLVGLLAIAGLAGCAVLLVAKKRKQNNG